MIRIYAVRLGETMAQGLLCDRLYGLASPERKAKADRYRVPEDRVRCLLAEALLRHAWHRAGHSEDLPAVTENAHGKPYMPDHPDFHFSISHGGDWVVLARHDRPVGADVEAVEEDRDVDALAKRYFSVDEYRSICHAPVEKFYALWTAKEAYLKYRGTGFACGAHTPDLQKDGAVMEGEKPVFLRRLALAGNHLLAVCGECEAFDVTYLPVGNLFEE